MSRRPNGVPHPALRPGLRVDRVGTEAVVLDGRAGVVHRLTGDAAEVLTELVMRGREVADLPARLADSVAGLREVGVLRPGIGRRRVLGTATVGALGIMSLALPSALVAASPGSTRVRGTATDVSTDGSLGPPAGAYASADFTYRTYDSPEGSGGSQYFAVGGSGYLVVDVLAVGGGGAGGNGYGGGGGGGTVSLLLERQLSVGGRFMVTVGVGGDASDTAAGFGSGIYDVDLPGFLVFARGAAPGGGSGGAGGQSYAGVNPGGNGGAGAPDLGGGGAGAGGAGNPPSGTTGGAGGPAFPVENFFSSPFAVAGGGGGAGRNTGPAGTGGGTGGSQFSGDPGQDATGPGGGGGGGGYADAGTGGDGLVVVRYLT